MLGGVTVGAMTVVEKWVEWEVRVRRTGDGWFFLLWSCGEVRFGDLG